MVAFEIARQLQAAGEDVASLVIWVVAAPEVYTRPSRIGTIKRVARHVVGQMVGEQGDRFRWRDLAPTLRHELLEYQIFGAMESYRPQTPYHGDLVLLRHHEAELPQYEEKSPGWKSLVAGDVSVYPLPGHHSDWLNKHADTLGRLLDEVLAAGEITRKAS